MALGDSTYLGHALISTLDLLLDGHDLIHTIYNGHRMKDEIICGILNPMMSILRGTHEKLRGVYADDMQMESIAV